MKGKTSLSASGSHIHLGMSSTSTWMVGNLPITRHFFKVMLSGFRTKLSIPLAFCSCLNGEKLEEAVLTSCEGSWHVKVGKCSKGGIYFEEGWADFAQHHGLDLGDFVVFEHKGHMVFDVLVFDSTACEREFPLSIKLASKRKRTPPQTNSHDHFIHSKGKSPVEAAASYSPKSPHFVATINASNGLRNFPYMNIPPEFVKSTKLTPKCSITLKDPFGKLWSVELLFRDGCAIGYKRVSMAAGWHEFYVSNKLKKGDVCIFELNHITRTTAPVVLDVRIFPL